MSNKQITFDQRLKKDKELWNAFKANIAMAFYDRCRQYKKEKNKKVLSNEDLHIIANEAAENFLKLWTAPVKKSKKPVNKKKRVTHIG